MLYLQYIKRQQLTKKEKKKKPANQFWKFVVVAPVMFLLGFCDEKRKNEANQQCTALECIQFWSFHAV